MKKKGKKAPLNPEIKSAIDTFVAGFVLYAIGNYDVLLTPQGLETGVIVAFLLAGVRAGVKPLITVASKWATSVIK